MPKTKPKPKEEIDLKLVANKTASNLINNLRDSVNIFRNAEIRLLATSLAFVTTLSIVPFLATGLYIFQIMGGFEKLFDRVKPLILRYLVPGTNETVVNELQSAIERIEGGTIGILGFVTLLFISTKVLSDIEKAVQKVWQIKETRPLLRRILAYWLVILLVPFGVAVTIGVLSSSPLSWLAGLPVQLIAFLIFFLPLFIIFKVVPNCRVQLVPALVAAGVTAFLLIKAQSLFITFVYNFLSYNRIYGSLATIPITLLWLLVLWFIFLGGVALTASLQRRHTLPVWQE